MKNIKYNVINYHFTSNCNYCCKHCFVDKSKKEISLTDKFKVIDHIESYFIENKVTNPRINLVGGEPFVSSQLGPIIEYIGSKGIDVSIVTNGTLICEKFLIKYSKYISTIGISVDSLNELTNILIGRCTRTNKIMSISNLIDNCLLIKKYGIKLKINICLSKLNVNEDLRWFLNIVSPDRLKVFAMTILDGINDGSSSNTITDEEFESFIEKIKCFNPIKEGNGQMENAYLMVDASGKLYINNNGREEIISDLVDDNYHFDTSLLVHEKYFQKYLTI